MSRNAESVNITCLKLDGLTLGCCFTHEKWLLFNTLLSLEPVLLICFPFLLLEMFSPESDLFGLGINLCLPLIAYLKS